MQDAIVVQASGLLSSLSPWGEGQAFFPRSHLLASRLLEVGTSLRQARRLHHNG